MVSLRLRQRSSSARARARASLPLISVAPTFVVPGKADGGAGHRGDAFLAAGKPEPFAGGGLHRDARQSKTSDLRDPRAHGFAQGADLRPLAYQRDVEMSDAPAARGNAVDGIFQEAVGRSILPLRIARRKMRADVAVRQRAQNGIDQRVQPDVAVGM